MRRRFRVPSDSLVGRRGKRERHTEDSDVGMHLVDNEVIVLSLIVDVEWRGSERRVSMHTPYRCCIALHVT